LGPVYESATIRTGGFCNLAVLGLDREVFQLS
jgi:hypothetical protein